MTSDNVTGSPGLKLTAPYNNEQFNLVCITQWMTVFFFTVISNLPCFYHSDLPQMTLRVVLIFLQSPQIDLVFIPVTFRKWPWELCGVFSMDIHQVVRKTQKWATTASNSIDSEDAKLVEQVSVLGKKKSRIAQMGCRCNQVYEALESYYVFDYQFGPSSLLFDPGFASKGNVCVSYTW